MPARARAGVVPRIDRTHHGSATSIYRNLNSTVATVISATLSCDHRVIDGALGSRALQSIASFLADPALALTLEKGL